MANLRDVRLRMRAVEQTLKVTKAMHLISTSKLRKGRRALEDTEPFFTRIQKSMIDIISRAGNVNNIYFGKKDYSDTGKKRTTAILVITSDKGLAGSFNAAVERKAIEAAKGAENPVIIPIGNIGYRYFAHSPYLMLENFSFQSRLPTVDDAEEVAEFVVSQFQWGVFDEVKVVYTHMYNTIKLVPEVRHLLPLREDLFKQDLSTYDRAERKPRNFEYIPSRHEVFEALVPFYVKGQIFGCLVESFASEQSARMTAMDEASKNAQDLLDKLQLSYNRVRQAGITQEMTEIVGGSSALAD
jgi:F-type H+-transporting ATPase subunit gamma